MSKGKRLGQEFRALTEEVARLRWDNAQLREENIRLKARVAELEERWGQNSQNSSKPPSTDPPSTPDRPPRSGSGRSPGGQPGHPGHQRELAPPERVKETIPLKPVQCRGCGAALSDEDPHPYRHQVTAIPKIEPLITEYQLHTLTCAHCQALTRATLPEGVPAGAFDPRTVAIVSLLTGFYHLSRLAAGRRDGGPFWSHDVFGGGHRLRARHERRPTTPSG